MPRRPPTAVRMTEEKERKLSPQRFGIYPPMVEPMTMHIQMSDFEFMG